MKYFPVCFATFTSGRIWSAMYDSLRYPTLNDDSAVSMCTSDLVSAPMFHSPPAYVLFIDRSDLPGSNFTQMMLDALESL